MENCAKATDKIWCANDKGKDRKKLNHLHTLQKLYCLSNMAFLSIAGVGHRWNAITKTQISSFMMTWIYVIYYNEATRGIEQQETLCVTKLSDNYHNSDDKDLSLCIYNHQKCHQHPTRQRNKIFLWIICLFYSKRFYEITVLMLKKRRNKTAAVRE